MLLSRLKRARFPYLSTVNLLFLVGNIPILNVNCSLIYFRSSVQSLEGRFEAGAREDGDKAAGDARHGRLSIHPDPSHHIISCDVRD